tara:strand:- start:8 stop:220 length:213 start_codon:yes stop_codon:yes gene_type:complete
MVTVGGEAVAFTAVIVTSSQSEVTVALDLALRCEVEMYFNPAMDKVPEIPDVYSMYELGIVVYEVGIILL